MFEAVDGNMIAVDTETTGLHWRAGDRPWAISFCNCGFESGYVEFPVDPKTRTVQYDVKLLKRVLRWISSVGTVWHGGKFDRDMLAAAARDIHFDWTPPKLCEETTFLMHAINSIEPSFELKYLGKKYLGITNDDEKELRKATSVERKHAKKRGEPIGDAVPADYWMAPLALRQEYAVNDAIRTMGLWLNGSVEVFEGHDRGAIYKTEKSYRSMIGEMESRGVAVNRKMVSDVLWRKSRLITRHQATLMNMAGKEINFDSPDQLVAWIYSVTVDKKNPYDDGTTRLVPTDDGLGLSVELWTGENKGGLGPEYGMPSTKIEHLRKRSKGNKWLETFCTMKSLMYEINFFKQYIHLMEPDPTIEGGWCLHPNIKQLGAKTSRFSIAEPSLQNIPDDKHTKTSTGMQARTPLGPRKGMMWMLFDYSQLEVRIFADRSGDPIFLDAIKRGADIHGAAANRAWGGKNNPRAVDAAMRTLDTDNPSEARRWLQKFQYDIVVAEASLEKEDHRTKAKDLVFCKLFGGGKRAAAGKMGCDLDEAAAFLAEYDDAFPHQKDWTKMVSDRAAVDGYVQNAYGRRIGVDGSTSYRAVNYDIQSSAADLLKDRMAAVRRWIKKRRLPMWLVLCVHDEVVIECDPSMYNLGIMRSIARIMTNHGGRFSVPMKVDVDVTWTNWVDKKKVDLKL